MLEITMLRIVIVVLLIISNLVSLGQSRRRPPNADLAEEYLRSLGPDVSRISDNLREDASLDVPDLIRKYRYPVEVHEIVTEDGYILEMQRIPYGRDQNNVPDPDRPVVIAMHGLLASAADYVFPGPGTALAYTLAEGGFDVWLGNARGTFYSRRHVSLDPDRDISYWQFSWDEMGRFDLPAMIDYVLAATNKTRLHYIGHSQGTTVFWVMGSMRPEYNDKIITMQAYAPVCYLEHNSNPLYVTIAPFADTIQSVAQMLGVGELLSRPTIIRLFGRTVCADGAPTQYLCSNLLFFVSGYSDTQHNATMFPVALAHTPAGASVRQIAHFGQQVGKSHFRRYSYDMMTNWFKYRSFTPPDYDLSKVTAPVFMHYVDDDVFADLRDMERLWNELGRPIAKIKVPYVPFSHLDFAWGQHAKPVLYDKTVEIMKVFPNN